MELSKVLLGALLLGVAVETTSCVKDHSKNVTPSTQAHNDVQQPNNNPDQHDPCPACGMG